LSDRRLPTVLAVPIVVYALALLVYLLLRFTLRDTVWWLAFLHNFAPYYFLPLLVLVPLLLLAGARRMGLRLLPLLLVAVLLYGPRWLPHSISTAAAERFKVVSFNILPFNPDLDRVADWLAGQQADLVLLQELGPEKSAQLFNLLPAVYPHRALITGSTTALLTNWLITSSELVDLGGWFVTRFVLDVDGEALTVYNIHMPVPALENQAHLNLPIDNGFVQLFLKYDETWRNGRIRELLARIAEESGPFIVAGDFNTSDNAMIYDELAAVMRDSWRETSTGLGATWPAGVGEEGIPAVIPTLLRLDYIWHSPDLPAYSTTIGPHLGSDHLPVIANLARP
jgi:endonuclease/exonuclease/phosphatase (EEP) superfamily protein YafD